MARRLRPLTDTRPKCLLEVGGSTLLQRTVDAMASAGVIDFIVVTGYREEMIRHALTPPTLPSLQGEGPGVGSVPPLTFRFLHNADYMYNNNIYSLWMASKLFRGSNVLLMDSDILCDPEAVRRVARHTASALAVQRHELGEEEMKVVVDADGRITAINKTCDPALAIGESVGIEHMTSDYSAALGDELDRMIEGEGLIDIFYERAFERLIPQGHTFDVVDTTDLFSYELDTPDDYYRATSLLPSTLLARPKDAY
jgi:choline kinase